jgi:hypothetical protein
MALHRRIGGQEVRNLVIRHPTYLAGIWFGVIGWSVWQIMIIIIYHRLLDLSFIVGLLPGAASGAIGARLGRKIVIEAPIQSKLFAARRGMAVMFLSLLFYCLLISSFTGIMDGSAIYALNIFTEFTLVGLIGFGWFLALVGAIGGLCLYWASHGPDQRREPISTKGW